MRDRQIDSTIHEWRIYMYTYVWCMYTSSGTLFI